METPGPSVFKYAVGGEPSLSPEQSRLWLDPSHAPNDNAIDDICRHFGGGENKALWLRYGRSALGVALDLSGVGPQTPIALPAYTCQAVTATAGTRSNALRYYELGHDLTPESEKITEAANRAGAVLTCSFFGSASIDERLDALGPRLREMAGEPWIIEDRALAFPEPLNTGDAAKRCDFMIFSFRKCYPVPDGAILVACSERARDAVSQKQPDNTAPPLQDTEQCVREKVMAKVKRHNWLTSGNLVDDPSLNGLDESIKSEALIDDAKSNCDADAQSGSWASAAYIMGRDLIEDRQTVCQRAETIVQGLGSNPALEIPLGDCTGIAVPMLTADRDRFLEQARRQGIFLPAHWPRDGSIPAGAGSNRWFEREVSLPTLPATRGADIDFMIDRLCQIQ